MRKDQNKEISKHSRYKLVGNNLSEQHVSDQYSEDFELRKDRHYLEQTVSQTPSKGEVLQLIELWQSTKPSNINTRILIILKVYLFISQRFKWFVLAPIALGLVPIFNGIFEYNFLYPRNEIKMVSATIMVNFIIIWVTILLGDLIFYRSIFNYTNQFSGITLDAKPKISGIIIKVITAVVTLGMVVEGAFLSYFLLNYRLNFSELLGTCFVIAVGIIYLGYGGFLQHQQINNNRVNSNLIRANNFFFFSKLKFKQRLALAFATLVIIILLIPAVIIIVSNTQSNQNYWGHVAVADNEDLELPPTDTYNGLFNKAKFVLTNSTVIDNLPASSAPTYKQIVKVWDIEDAKSFASSLGFDPQGIVQNESLDTYTFVNSDKSKLVLSRKIKGLWSYSKNPDNNFSLPGVLPNLAVSPNYNGKKITLKDATDIATNFLGEKSKIFQNTNFVYINDSNNGSMEDPNYLNEIQSLTFAQTIDGFTVYGPSTKIEVGANGEILQVASNVLPLEKAQIFQLDAPNTVVDKVNQRSLLLFQTQIGNNEITGNFSNPDIQSSYNGCPFTPAEPTLPLPDQMGPHFEVGQTIDITGVFNATVYRDMLGKEPDHHVASLSSKEKSSYYTFFLQGQKVTDMVSLSNYQLNIIGKVTAVVPQTPPGLCSRQPYTEQLSYKIEVLNYQKHPLNQDRIPFIGKITYQTISGKSYQILTDDNGALYINQSFEDEIPFWEDHEVFVKEAENQTGIGTQKVVGTLQKTGETLEGLPLVKVLGSIGPLSNGNSNRNDIKAPDSPYTAAVSSADSELNGEIKVQNVKLAYYVPAVSVGQLYSNTTGEIVQPVYLITGIFTNSKGTDKRTVTITAPTLNPDILLKEKN